MMNNNDNRESIEQLDELMEAYSRRLHKLQIRVAIEGRDARPADQIEIEDIEKKIGELAQQRNVLASSREKLSPSQTAEFQKTRDAIQSKDTEPIEVKAAFANREVELRSILSPFSKPFIFVSAPAGYGKTYLLEEVRRRLESDEKGKWLVIRHDCHPDDTEAAVPESLVRQMGYKETDPTRTLDEFLLRVNRAMGHARADGLMILFDSIERWKQNNNECFPWTAAGRFVQQTLVTVLYEAMRFGGRKFKVIFAGRYIGDFTKDFHLPYQEFGLSPFGLEVTRMFIQETSLRFEDIRSTRLSYSFQDIEYLAEEMFDITGGHPKAIVRLIQDIGENEFAIAPKFYFRDDHKRRLFDQFVAAEIVQLLKSISPSLQQVLRTLSIFRGFNGDTLNALLDKGYIAKVGQSDGWNLYSQILGTHLVEPTAPLAHDRILRRVLDIQVRFDDPDKYLNLHRFATQLYDQWLQGLDHHRERLESGIPTGTDQIQFVLESLYHICRSCEGEAVCAQQLDEKREHYLSLLRYPGGQTQGRRALCRAIEEDEQLPILLKRVIGVEGYSSLLARISA